MMGKIVPPSISFSIFFKCILTPKPISLSLRREKNRDVEERGGKIISTYCGCGFLWLGKDYRSTEVKGGVKF